MNLAGKKAFVASCVAHGLLLAFLVISPAFMKPVEENPDIDLPVIEFVADQLIDDALYVPPAPEPTPQQPEPTPEPPVKEVVKTPEPEPVPQPKPEPPKVDPKPEPKKVEEKPAWKPNTQVAVSAEPREVKVQQPKPQPTNQNSDLQRELDKTINNVKSKSTRTEINFSSSDVSYANYGQEVLRRYNAAWVTPTGENVRDGFVQVRVVILKDGTIKQASIIAPSGQAVLDSSVRKALDAVKKIAPFPAGAKENERTYTIKLFVENS